MTQHIEPAQMGHHRAVDPARVLDVRRKYDEAMHEAEQLWRSATLATALLRSPYERLAAAELVRDAAFCVMHDLATPRTTPTVDP